MNDVTRMLAGDLARIAQSHQAPSPSRAAQPDAKPGTRSLDTASAQRLDAALNRPNTIERDVPRGTYLDILV